MTIRGSLEADKDEPPRILMEEPAPGPPPLLIIDTPGAFPCSRSAGEVARPLFNWSASTDTTDPVASLFFTVP